MYKYMHAYIHVGTLYMNIHAHTVAAMKQRPCNIRRPAIAGAHLEEREHGARKIAEVLGVILAVEAHRKDSINACDLPVI